MQPQDCITLLRNVISDNSNRWSAASLLNFVDRGNKRIVSDILFPDGTVTQPTVLNKQLYAWPLMLRVDAFYVDGELIVPSDLPTLEGRGTWQWDASNVTGTPTAGSDAPAGTTGPQAPQWAVSSPISYPNAQGVWVYPNPPNPVPLSGMFSPYDRSRFYWRGGSLGISPPPANTDPVATMQLDGIPYPQTLLTPTDTMMSPDNFMEAIVWAALALMFFGDTSRDGQAQRQSAEAGYMSERRRLIRWLGMREGPKPDLPLPQVLRRVYGRYHKVRSGR